MDRRDKYPVLVWFAYRFYRFFHFLVAVADVRGKMGYRVNRRLTRVLRILAPALWMAPYCYWYVRSHPSPSQAFPLMLKYLALYFAAYALLLFPSLLLGEIFMRSANAYYRRTGQIPKLLVLMDMLLRVDELQLRHAKGSSAVVFRSRIRTGLFLYGAACEDRIRALRGAEKLREFAPDSWEQVIEERVRETRIELSENARRIISDVVSEVRAGAQKSPRPAPDEQTQQL